MSQLVQARCPSCQSVLRIPAAWLNQTIRCSHCKAAFQAKAPASTPLPRPAVPAPMSKPFAPPPASLRATPPPPPAKLAATPIWTPPAQTPPAAPRPQPAAAAPASMGPAPFFVQPRSPLPRRKSGFFSGMLLWTGVLLVAGALGFLAWPEISGLFSGKPADKDKVAAKDKDKDKNAVVVIDPKKSEDPPADKTTKGDDKGSKTDKLVEPKKTTDDKKEPKKDDTPKKDDPKKDEPKKDEPKKIDEPKKKEEPKKIDEPKKKVEEPKKVDEPKKTTEEPKKKTPVIVKGSGGEFPRRALLVNVSNYLLFNPLFYGQDKDGKRPGGSTTAVANRLALPPMNFPKSQVFELADGKPRGHGTTKSVIEAAITDFLETSREQDRVLLLFTGHAMEIEGEGYLVPVDGNRKNADSLIKLSWVYERLKACKARQKVFILDVFRFPPARGEEIDGTGALTEAFAVQMEKVPAGVQVWSTCSKDQQSIELENGSVFLQAFNQACKDAKVGIAQPDESIPVEDLLPLVNKTLKDRLGKVEQVSLMVGKEEPGKAYDKSEPLAETLTFKEAGSGDPTTRLTVQGILDEINLMPALRGNRPTIPVSSVLPFIKKLKEYEADYANLRELEKTIMADKEKYPLRAAYFEAIEVLKECAKFPVKDYQAGPVTDALKKSIEALQKDVPAMLDFKLKSIKAKLEELDETERDKETSKRWLANFDYVKTMVTAKIVFLNEYNYLLAGIRAERMPELEGAPGWRVGSAKKLSTSESYIKGLNKALPKAWDKIAKDHKDTPWAILANRESMTAMGLEWRAAKD